jgi:hypothetical protein
MWTPYDLAFATPVDSIAAGFGLTSAGPVGAGLAPILLIVKLMR